MTRHLFVLNPAAGTKDRTEKLKEAVKRLKLDGICDIFITDGVRAAENEVFRYLGEHKDDFVRIYACGGDGTLSEVTNGIYRSGSKNCAVAVVPIGSGNDFVKSLGIPAECFLDLQKLTEGNTIDIDLLVARDATNAERASLNIISAGFDAAVAHGQEKIKKWPLVSGKTAYNISLVKSVFTKTKHYFVLKVDGQRFGDSAGPYLFAIAANGKYYGGGFKASPYSDISDGIMEFIRIDTVSPVKLLSLVGKFREGRHIDEIKDIVAAKQCKSMQFVSDKPIDINLDGEIYPMKNPTIRIVEKAMKIILPKQDD